MTKQYTSGWDYFTPDPGTVDEKHCRACGTKMDVQRNVNGPTGYAEAIGGGKHLHDSFSCPNTGEKWHDQAIKLLMEANNTPSKTLEDIYRKEAKEAIEERKPTK